MKTPASFRFTPRALAATAILASVVLLSGCAVWNPFGYSEEWPLWKKTLFFAGPGHCPVCYCVGGAIVEAAKDKDDPAQAAAPIGEPAEAGESLTPEARN